MAGRYPYRPQPQQQFGQQRAAVHLVTPPPHILHMGPAYKVSSPHPRQTTPQSQHFYNPTTQQFQGALLFGSTPTTRLIGTTVDGIINRTDDFMRAMKVFYITYGEVTNDSSQILRDKYEEFVDTMCDLYDIPKATLTTPSFEAEMNDWKKETISVVIEVKESEGLNIQEPVLKVKEKKDTLGRIQLEQPLPQSVKIALSMEQYLQYRNNPNRVIKLSLRSRSWMRHFSKGSRKSYLYLSNIHPEGYENWIDFGDGIRFKICVNFTVEYEQYLGNTINASDSHLTAIYYMLKKRLTAYNVEHPWADPGHRSFALKHRIEFSRKFVQNETDMFWREPLTDLYVLEPTVNIVLPSTVRPIVYYTDMQLMFDERESLEKSVCLCSEWCNWNAFFYYNPIYRFLMVRQFQLFLRDYKNIPDMYLYVSVSFPVDRLNIYRRQPILKLIESSNECRKQFYFNFVQKYQNIRDLYWDYPPSPVECNIKVYFKMRCQFDIHNIAHDLDVNLFSDNCVEYLLNYYKVFSDLHIYLSFCRDFVPRDDKRRFLYDLDVINRIKFKEYFTYGIEQSLLRQEGDFDYLFSEDYEYSNCVVSDEIRNIKRQRDEILSKVPGLNPRNIQITLNSFLSTFISIYKFIARVELLLPISRAVEPNAIVYETYRNFDDTFKVIASIRTLEYSFRPNPPQLDVNPSVFYTLKLYYYLFEIQKHCIQSTVNYNQYIKEFKYQTSQSFTFIWDNRLLEGTHRRYFGQNLFRGTQDYTPLFDLLYDFYGVPHHEQIHPNVIIFDNIYESAFWGYIKLYVWNKNNGNTRHRFSQIIETLDDDLRNNAFFSYQILTTTIIPDVSLLWGTPLERCSLILDHLVYYLVKAYCSITLSTVAMFFKGMHSLQNPFLCENFGCFSFIKPGWVQLLETIILFNEEINEYQTNHIVFDDEFDRISNTLTQTKDLIKRIYRDFYCKLSIDWCLEIWYFINKANDPSRSHRLPRINLNVNLFYMHLSYGLTFILHFFNMFRRPSFMFRKRVSRSFVANPSTNMFTRNEYLSMKHLMLALSLNENAILNCNPYEVQSSAPLRLLKDYMDRYSPAHFIWDMNLADY